MYTFTVASSLKTKIERSNAPCTITKITTAIQNVNQNNSSIDLAYGPSGLKESNGAFSIQAEKKITAKNLKFFNLIMFFTSIFILSTIIKDSAETIYSVIISTMSLWTLLAKKTYLNL